VQQTVEIILMVHNIKMLQAIPSTEPASFNEFLRGYDDAPERGDKGGWSELFQDLETLESQGLIEIERANGRIDTLMLTADGADVVRSS
jgi:predicted transcriptional regulator